MARRLTLEEEGGGSVDWSASAGAFEPLGDDAEESGVVDDIDRGAASGGSGDADVTVATAGAACGTGSVAPPAAAVPPTAVREMDSAGAGHAGDATDANTEHSGPASSVMPPDEVAREMASMVEGIRSELADGSLSVPDFHSAEYWERRFREDRGAEHLDWYPEAVPLLLERLRECSAGAAAGDVAVVLGCGTSKLSFTVWHELRCRVHSIDFSERAIQLMRGTVRRDADINWTVADVCSDDWDGGLRSGAFAVLDKGTSDAVMSDKRSARQRMAQLRERIVRALRPSGRWLVVSHSPPHLRLEHLCPRIAQTREAENFDLHRATAAATKAQATAAIRAAMASATEREPVVAETGREGGGVAPPLDGHPLLHLSGSSLEDSPWSAVQVFVMGATLSTYLYELELKPGVPPLSTGA